MTTDSEQSYENDEVSFPDEGEQEQFEGLVDVAHEIGMAALRAVEADQ